MTWEQLSWRMQSHLKAFCAGGLGVLCLPSSAAAFFLEHDLAERTDQNSRGLRPTELARALVRGR